MFMITFTKYSMLFGILFLIIGCTFTSFQDNKTKIKLNLADYKEVISIKDDRWNDIQNGDVTRKYYNAEDKEIGYMNYRVKVGQVGIFVIEENYRDKGLGKQILNLTMIDMKNHGAEEIWAVTTKDHTFWSNVYNKSFTWRDPAHPSVGGGGYFMKLE